MSPEVISMQIVAGGLLGMLGQGVRVIAGLKKAHDSASQQNLNMKIEAGSLTVSLFIGFTAGALALLTASELNAGFDIDKSTMTALIAAGYAGTDFIEAFMKKYLPGGSSMNKPDALAATATSAAQSEEQPAVG